MRSLVLLGLVVVSFVLFVKFYPSSVDEGTVRASGGPVEVADAGLPPASGASRGTGGAGFLERPKLRVAPAPKATPVPARSTAATTEIPGDASWLAGVEPLPALDEGEVEVAAALLHGTEADVRRAIADVDGFPIHRARMAEAFAMAMAGRAREGLVLAGDLDEGHLTAREKALLQSALGGTPLESGAVEASMSASPLVLAMEMALLGRKAEQYGRARSYQPAARAFSDLLMAELDAPWAASRELLARWTEGLDGAQQHHRWSPKGNWPAVEYAVPPGGTAIGVRKDYLADHPGRIMCSGLILQSNAVRGYLQANQVLRIPTDPVRVLVDLSARWVLYITGDEVAGSWPVAIGRPGEETITGDFAAGNKTENPSWMRVGYPAVPFGDPANPLGTRWIGWFDDGATTSYGFHGTKAPETIGTASSDGCIRFHNADVERLFEILPDGAPILVRE